jgi:hypothetical protein
LLAYLPFRNDTWDRLDKLLGSDQASYWRATNANAFEADDAIAFAVEKLIDYGRPFAAVRCIHRSLHAKKPLDSELTVRALLAAIQSTEVPHGSDGYEIAQIISALQADEEANPDAVFRVEWAYLPILDDYRQASPKILESRLATDPAFFCEIVRLVFRSKHGADRPVPTPEDAPTIAANAYRLLSKWRMPPGTQKDGSFVSTDLVNWIEKVKEESSASGHLEVAMTMLGHALTHVPKDPDGLWIHRGAADALNARDAGDIRDGFRVELYNSRGVHGFTAGKAELDIALRYREQAAELDEEGFHRFAGTLKELAATYEREAERASKRDSFGQ